MTNKTTHYLKYGNMFVKKFDSVPLHDSSYQVTEMHLTLSHEGCLDFPTHEEAVKSAHHIYFKICRESLIYELFEQDGTPVVNGA